MTTKWTNEFLDKKRLIGDPAADEVAQILWKGKDREIMNTLKFISANHHGRVEPSLNKMGLIALMAPGDAEKISNYFKLADDFHTTVTEEDKVHFATSARIFDQYGYLITSILFFKSLPTGYLCPKPGTVLATTKLLENFAARRVMETSQFVFAVNKADWYLPDSPGIMAVEKVRLMHAGMRMGILNNPNAKWDMSLGVPINQEDITLTNHLFSLAIIEGLDYIGVHLFDHEREAIFRTWQKVGQALGIEQDMLNVSYNDAWDQYRTILKRQVHVKNEAGPPLTHALLAAMNTLTHEDISMNVLEDITRYFLNDGRSVQSLGLHKPSIFDKAIEWSLRTVLSSTIWQFLFHRTRGGIIQKLVKKAGNFILIHKFGLGSYIKSHPDQPPLTAFTKVLLQELSTKDMTTFEKMSDAEKKKKFFIDNKLFLEWDLGGFEMNVNLKRT